jgi:hypothetical protein
MVVQYILFETVFFSL